MEARQAAVQGSEESFQGAKDWTLRIIRGLSKFILGCFAFFGYLTKLTKAG